MIDFTFDGGGLSLRAVLQHRKKGMVVEANDRKRAETVAEFYMEKRIVVSGGAIADPADEQDAFKFFASGSIRMFQILDRQV